MFVPISAFADWTSYSNDFVTTWKTSDGKITLNFQKSDGPTDYYLISWYCDGNYEVGFYAKTGYDYGTSWIYDVCIQSPLTPLAFYAPGLTTDEKSKLQEIKQWWNIKWSSFNSAFKDMTNVQLTATDVPDLSLVTDMSSAFQGATNFTGNASMSGRDTSNVINMSRVFRSAKKFNAPIGWWKTQNVTDMSEMFSEAHFFNQDISNWNLGKVTTVRDMFSSALKFNNGEVAGASGKSLPWNTEHVKDFFGMFRSAVSFNQPVGSWNTSSGTNMERMFDRAHRFNQPLQNWDTSNVTTMLAMFQMAYAFNQDLSHFNTQNVKDMNSMFWSASKFNQDISSWNISNVKTFRNLLELTSFSMENYEKLLTGWSTQTVQPNVLLGAQGISYCSVAAQTARNKLVSAPNYWIITDSGSICPPANITLSNTFVDEETTYVGQITGMDDNLPLTFSLVSGEGSEDNTKFSLSIDGSLAFATAPDFETPLGNGGNSGNNYTIRVQAKNTRNLTTEAIFIITVIDIDDFPPVIEIIPSIKENNWPITGTKIKVSDRFSIESISLNWSTTAYDNFVCSGSLPFINPTPVSGHHGVITCDVNIKSSGRLVVTAKDLSWNIATVSEDGYRIESLWPQLTVFKVDTQTYGVDKPIVHFDVLDPSALEKYELIYTENDNNSGTVSSTTSTWTYTTWSAYIPWGVVLNLDPDEKPHSITIKAYGKCGNITTRPIVFWPTVVFETPTMVSSWIINDTVKIYASATGKTLGEVKVSGTWATLIGCKDFSWNVVTAPYSTNIICNITVDQTTVVNVEVKETPWFTGHNSQKYFVETNAPAIAIFPSMKSSNQAITWTVEIHDDVAIDADKITWTTNPAGQLSDRNCVQTNGKRVDCSWTLSWSSSLTISTIDKAGNLSGKTETGFVIDTIPPVVTLTSTEVINSQNQWAYLLNGTCTSGDNDVYVTLNGQPFITSCNVWNWTLTGDFSSSITYPDWNITIQVSQTDALWNSTTITGLLIKDTKAPLFTVFPTDWAYLNQSLTKISGTSESWAVIGILSGTQLFTGSVNSSWNWNIPISPVFSEGNHTITVSAKDEHGNKSIDHNINFTIDTIQPVLTLSGSATVNLFVGDSFVDEWATRTDNMDWTGIVYSLDLVDTTKEWTHELVYYYIDQAGNSALTVKRTVVVKALANTWTSYYRWRYVRHNLNEQQHNSPDIIDDENTISDPELIGAYKRAYTHWITTLSPISKARLYDPITRSELAKMMSVYTMNYGNREQLKWKEWCDWYTDIDNVDAELSNYIKTACELEIMWLQSDWKTPLQEFRPNDYVSRAEFSTVFSRMLEGNKYDNNKDDARWVDHLNYLHDKFIIKKPDPTITELRAWILLMMYRAS